MRTLAQDQARRPNRIADALNASYSAGAHGSAVHDQRIHLDFSISCKKTAEGGIESVVIFHDHDSFFDRFQRRASRDKDFPTNAKRILHAPTMIFHNLVGHRPSSAMYHQDWVYLQPSPRTEEMRLIHLPRPNTARYDSARSCYLYFPHQ